MKKFRSLLSLVLVASMILGMVIIGNAATANYEFEEVGPNTSLAGYAQVIGQITEIEYESVKNTYDFKVKFDVYVDTDAYKNFYAARFDFYFDHEIITFVRAEGDDNDVVTSTATTMEAGKVRLVVGNPYQTFADADGYCGSFYLTYRIADAEAFKALDAEVGTLVEADVSQDFTLLGYDGSLIEVDSKWIEDGSLDKNYSTPAIVTYSANKVTYDADGGTGTTPVARAVGKGASHTVEGTPTSLTKTIDGVLNILDGWKSSYNSTVYHVYPTAESFTMPDTNVTLTAQYTPDANGDGIGDKYENIVTYTLRAADVGGATLNFSAATDHGKFYNATTTSGTIAVPQGDTIGNAVPGYTLTTDWYLVGFYVGDVKITDMASYVPTGNTAVEIRLMLDKNGNGVDDRGPVDITFKDSGDIVDTVTVPDNTPYTVFKNPDGGVSKTGNVDGNNPIIDLTGLADPTDSNGNPFDHWEVNLIKDPEGNVIAIEVVPKYLESIDVVIPGPIIDASGDDPTPGIQDKVEIDMDNGTIIIYRGLGGVEISRVTVNQTNVVNGTLNLTNPALGSYAALPVQNNGNAFVAWVFSGPEVINDVTYYYMDASYAESVHFVVEDADKVPVFDDDVPNGSTYEVYDKDGNKVDSGTLTDDKTVTLPDMPVKNEDGDYFYGWDVEAVDTDGDGVDDKFVFSPIFETPEPDEIEFIPEIPGTDPGTSDNTDALTGEGYTILKGAHASDTTASVRFYLRVAGNPADATDLQNLTFKATRAYGFESLAGSTTYGTLATSASYVGTKEISGKVYGEFSITYNTVKSSVVRITATYGATTNVDKGHIVVTVGDVDKNGRITATDYVKTLSVVNEIDTYPSRGSASGYVFELMDMDKNTRIAATDYITILSMVNEIIVSN